MKSNLVKLARTAVLLAVTGMMVFTGCAGETEPTSPPPAGEWQWPEKMHVAAAGASGLAKYASFLSIMEADTGMTIRIQSEARPAKHAILVKSGDMFCVGVDKTGLGSQMAGRENFATRDGGPWPARVLWISDLSNAGFFVRGDSDIKTLDDIKPGVRFSVWGMEESTLRWPRALLKWIELDEDDVVWADAGSTGAAVRAITDGRADIMFFFPITPQIYEAAAAPGGIRFLDLNSELDPDGAARLNEDIPGTQFAPMAVGPEGAIGVWGTITHKLIVTREASDPELVYNFVKWLDENHDLYKETYATNKFMTLDNLVSGLESTFIPAHEGLIQYLDEQEIWNEAMEQHNQENLTIMNELITAYEDAIVQADAAGIDVDPTNVDWIKFWEKYKTDHNTPEVAPPMMDIEPAAPVVIPPPTVEGDITFELVSITNPAYRQGDLIVVAKTEPGTEAVIRMWFEGGRESTITFRDKDHKIADADGKLQFDGLLGHTVDGVAKLEITLTLGDRSGLATVYTEITR